MKTLKTDQGASEEPCSEAAPVEFSSVGPKGRARNGKIARLPEAVRAELNQHLLDGEQAVEILPWLDGLPVVQKVLQKHFDGQGITEENLSGWRHGGYQGWLQERSTAEAVSSIAAACAGLNEDDHEEMNRNLSIVLAARLAGELRRYDTMDEGEDKSAAWSRLVASFFLLRRAEFYGVKVGEEKRRLKRIREKEAKDEPLSPAQAQERIDEIMGTGRFECKWDNEKKIYVGPGAAMHYEEAEVTRLVREEMKRRYPNGFREGYHPPYASPLPT